MIKSFENRVLKLEKNIQYYDNENNPCECYIFPENTTREEIIKALNITKKEFTKWKTNRDNLNEIMVFTPNWSVEKYILQHSKELNSFGSK